MTGVPGLGTSTSKEAKEYFSEMERHRIMFRYGGTEDDSAITLVSSVSMETAARCLDQRQLSVGPFDLVQVECGSYVNGKKN